MEPITLKCSIYSKFLFKYIKDILSVFTKDDILRNVHFAGTQHVYRKFYPTSFENLLRIIPWPLISIQCT